MQQPQTPPQQSPPRGNPPQQSPPPDFRPPSAISSNERSVSLKRESDSLSESGCQSAFTVGTRSNYSSSSLTYRLDVNIKPDVGEISASTANAADDAASSSVREVIPGIDSRFNVDHDAEENTFVCTLCPFDNAFESREKLVTHFFHVELKDEFDPLVLFCADCVDEKGEKLTFKSKGDKIDHVLEKHGCLKKLKCDRCTETFWFESEMDHHIERECGGGYKGGVLHGGSGGSGTLTHVFSGDSHLSYIGGL